MVQLKECVKFLERYSQQNCRGISEGAAQTSYDIHRERRNLPTPYRHHTGHTSAEPHQRPTTTHTQTAHQKSTHDGRRTSPPKAEISRGTPSRKRTGTTRHLQQACPRGLGLTHQRHPITPTIPQIGPLKNHLKQERPQAPHHIYPQQTNRAQTAAIHRNQPPKKPQQTRKQQGAHRAQARHLSTANPQN